MRNFTNEEIKTLVDNGFIMPASEKYHIRYYPKKTSKFAPVGYPVIFDKNEFLKCNNDFPVTLLKEYHFTFESQGKYYHNSYLIPNGLQDLVNFNSDNVELFNKLQEWIALSELFILEETTGKKQQQIEIDLLKLFRELYFLYILDRKTNFSPTDNLFFDLFDNGQSYRHIIKKYIPHLFASFNNQPDTFNIITETTENLILFEKFAIANTKEHHASFCNIRYNLLNLWSYLLEKKSLVGSYNIASPFYQNFKNALLHFNYNRCAIKDTIYLLEWLNPYDFSLLKDIYLELLKKSNKVALSNYVKEKLTLNNALPQLSQELVIKQVSSLVYKHTFTFDFSLIKSYVNDHLYAGQCLVAIVEKAFRENELDCSKVAWQHLKKDNVIIFLIETVQKNKTEELNKKLIIYMNTVLSPEFLDEAMVKLLCKHASNAYTRKDYENSKGVMSKYLNLKDKFLLKAKLEKKLVSKKSTEKIKKI